ncbi:MAG: outer membrane beta-barrel protein, partial [Verrucomicrobia bacterium]|nr:outer membrane beta-barrel protein [Verrucomicrobiota bacterium]
FEYSYSGTAKYSNFIVDPSIGYNFILGFGYQINSNLGIELEVGYSQNSLGNVSYTVNTSGSGAGTYLGLPFSGTASGSGPGSLSGSGSLTYIPILINLSIQEKSSTFQPLASVGFGACPTILKINNANLNYSESGTINGEIVGIPFSSSYSGVLSGFGNVGSQTTAIPFAFKLKAGFDYELNRHASVGLRAWAMGLANSDFGDELQSDLYGAIGLNASFKVRF